MPRLRRLRPQPRAGSPELRPLPKPDPILHSKEEQFEQEFLAWGRGTRPEYIVWRWLVRVKKQVEGVDFFFQSSRFGGRQVFGGIIVDFWFPTRRMFWRVQGERFHLLLPEDRMKDRVARLRLESGGNTVVDLWVRDLDTRPEYVLKLAWEGREPVSPLEDL